MKEFKNMDVIGGSVQTLARTPRFRAFPLPARGGDIGSADKGAAQKPRWVFVWRFFFFSPLPESSNEPNRRREPIVSIVWEQVTARLRRGPAGDGGGCAAPGLGAAGP